MKCWEQSKIRFPKVWWLYEQRSKGKWLFKVSEKIEIRKFFGKSQTLLKSPECIRIGLNRSEWVNNTSEDFQKKRSQLRENFEKVASFHPLGLPKDGLCTVFGGSSVRARRVPPMAGWFPKLVQKQVPFNKFK